MMTTEMTLLIALIGTAAVIAVLVLEIKTKRIVREREQRQRTAAIDALRKKK